MKKALKLISITAYIGGAVFLLWGGWLYIENRILEKNALEEADRIIHQAEEGSQKKESFDPQLFSTVGILEIPRIEAMLPIVEGADEDSLKRGVGHYTGTGYPMDADQIMLSGHRDTVFKRLGELEAGDILSITMPYGRFDYQIVGTKIVDADDRSIIVPHSEEVLTLSTCYPFGYLGNAPQRYIIDAKPVERPKG